MELLKDPSNDRAVKTLKPPPHRPLSRQLMFPDRLKSTPNIK
jgi:serine/threonine-protein phosphatase 2B catalytic subunit